MLKEGLLRETTTLASAIPWFLVAKPSGSARLLCDYSQWTNVYKVPDMHLKNIPLVLKTSSPEDHAVKIDLKPGFFQLPLHPDCWKFHGLHHGDKKFVFTRLPMGNSLSPFVMQRTSEAILDTLAQIYDYCMVTHAYLDDWLLIAKSPANHVVSYVRQSVTINEEKSSLRPMQVLTYLGLQIDLKQGTVFPSSKLATKAKQLASALPEMGFHARRESIGFLNWLFYQLGMLLFPITNALFGSFEDLKKVDWTHLESPHQIRPSEIFLDVFTDATPTQGAIVIPSLNMVEIFAWPGITLEINAAETMAVFCGLVRAIDVSLETAYIRLHTDSASAFWALQNGTGQTFRHDFVRRVARGWKSTKQRRTFSTHWIPTSTNIADGPSRFPLSSDPPDPSLPLLSELLGPDETTVLVDEWDPDDLLLSLAPIPPVVHKKPVVTPENVIFRQKQAVKKF